MIFLFVFVLAESSAMEPYVVGGNRVPIEIHAHSVFLSIRDYQGAFICGASILNQKILITAAHCFETNPVANNVYAFVGCSNKSQGRKYQVASYKLHEQYDQEEVSNDIGLAILKVPLKLGNTVKRVAILQVPPVRKSATVAGWGLIDEINAKKSPWLHSTNQKVWTWAQCSRMISKIPKGCFCAGDILEMRYASEGDSGSALIINGYVQIGLVSFKRPDRSRGVVVYTNVSYYYNWIKINAREMYCSDKRG